MLQAATSFFFLFLLFHSIRECRTRRKSRKRYLHPYVIFALEKSISGCSFLKFSSMSNFCCSSLVGNPNAFCLWSNIIFSTVFRVSPSRSVSDEFSGWIFLTLTFTSSSVHTQSHHSIWFSFCKLMTSRLPSSTVQNESSQMIGLHNGELSTIVFIDDVSLSRSVTLSCVRPMLTFKSRPRVPSGTGILTVTSDNVCVQTYRLVMAPFPTGGGPPSSPSSTSASSFLSPFADSSLLVPIVT
mmetsp:Transcript_45762/g.111577  ORF Transcript_45762/g.111577 Transcript_45762/m.111577 type:complete len:241 (-) Transcript_45762:632-1354(-)